MAIPLRSLDDRSFDDLVAEARARLARQLPELTRVAEGDPVHALVDLFAWLTETTLYRANLITERQRQAFLNLLQLPLRPAVPAHGLVSIDAKPSRNLPPLVADESALKAGSATFTTAGELQPTPLALHVLIKERLSSDDLAAFGVTKDQLRQQYDALGDIDAFRPRTLLPGIDPLDLTLSLDGNLYLAFAVEASLVPHAKALRKKLAGITLNMGLAPEVDVPAELQTAIHARPLLWELAWQAEPDEELTTWLPLEVLKDSSLGGRQTGVTRLRLPKNPALLEARLPSDPQQSGYSNRPPEPPAEVTPEQVLFWLRLRPADGIPFQLGYLTVNAVAVTGQGVARDLMVGVGTGRPGQAFALQHQHIDPASLLLDVGDQGRFETWQQVAHFGGAGADDQVYRLDPAAGTVQFGDGLRGRRPPAGSRIRAQVYRHGGGGAGNLPAGGISELVGGGPLLKLRHEWPTTGGLDGETVAQAEQRIPAHLTHRNRAVTRDDYAVLARDNPVNPVARAEAVPGLLPGASLGAVREQVPGVVSVFVLPPAAPALAAAPRPTAALLEDVYEYLDARKPLGSELYVLSPQFVPIALSLAIRVVDASTEQETIARVNDSLLQYLWALPPGGPRDRGWGMGDDIDLDELRTVAGRDEGVKKVGQIRLFRQLADGSWAELSGRVLSLDPYQLPELAAVHTEVSDNSPGIPPIADPEAGGGGGGKTPTPVPAPVIPDLC